MLLSSNEKSYYCSDVISFILACILAFTLLQKKHDVLVIEI